LFFILVVLFQLVDFLLFLIPLFCFFSSIRLAIHINDMSPVSDAIHHCRGEHRIPEDLAPTVEGQVGSDNG